MVAGSGAAAVLVTALGACLACSGPVGQLTRAATVAGQEPTSISSGQEHETHEPAAPDWLSIEPVTEEIAPGQTAFDVIVHADAGGDVELQVVTPGTSFDSGSRSNRYHLEPGGSGIRERLTFHRASPAPRVRPDLPEPMAQRDRPVWRDRPDRPPTWSAPTVWMSAT